MRSKKKERKLKKMIAARDKFYERNHLALPENVTACERAVAKAVAKRGHKPYRKDRERCERFLKKLFKLHHIRKTTSERFWYLTLMCRLIGPPLEIRRTVKVLEKTYVRPREKSSKKFKRRKRKRR